MLSVIDIEDVFVSISLSKYLSVPWALITTTDSSL